MQNVCDTLYTADYVITQNDGRDIIKQGAIAVCEDHILCVGHTDILEILYPDARRVDLGNAAIMPGLINAHTHVPMSLLRGYSDDKALMDWLTQDIFPQEAKLSPELVELGTRFSLAEMIRTGTTAFYDMYMWERSVFKAADDMGMRAVLGESVTQFFPSLSCQDQEAYFDLVRQQAEEWKGHPRIRQAVVPHAPYTTNPELLKKCYALAEETGSLFGMHLAETQNETDTCLKEHGMRPIPYCNSLGLLQPGSTFFHVVHADAQDMELLAEGHCAVVHNPASNMKLASGVAPVGTFGNYRIPVGLGTDGPASNNAQNMFREMYVASLLQKVHTLEPTACPAQTALDMATRGGSDALHCPHIGTLEPGMKADFIALDLSSPNMQPVHNIVSNIVYAATGLENRLTVVNGKELYRDGKFLTCDFDALSQEIQKARAWVRS